jgi:formate--tetrahydrofolate ligase
MAFKSDIEIAQATTPEDIRVIAQRAGIDEKYLELYGNHKAKIDFNILNDKKDTTDGKLILVTAITPTPAGEGKTTTTVGLSDGLHKIGKSLFALREPSLGPVWRQRRAAGGGYAKWCHGRYQLTFTGDFHAIGAANNFWQPC